MLAIHYLTDKDKADIFFGKTGKFIKYSVLANNK